MTECSSRDAAHANVHKLPLQMTRHTIAAITQERAYILPHPALRKIISHYTIYAPKRDARPGLITVIPDASAAIACCMHPHGLDTHLWGPSSRATAVESDPQKIPFYIMVEFFPCGASCIFDFPLSSFQNTVSPLDAADRPLARFLCEQVEKNLAAVAPGGLDAFFAALDQAFLRRFKGAGPPRLPQHIFGELQRVQGSLRIADIARQSGYSERHLNRVMLETTGVGAKLLARIIRINAACLAMRAPSISLTRLAHALHYHDQSHFIHDFKIICGVTPGEYMQGMSAFYNEELKFGDTFPEK